MKTLLIECATYDSLIAYLAQICRSFSFIDRLCWWKWADNWRLPTGFSKSDRHLSAKTLKNFGDYQWNSGLPFLIFFLLDIIPYRLPTDIYFKGQFFILINFFFHSRIKTYIAEFEWAFKPMLCRFVYNHFLVDSKLLSSLSLLKLICPPIQNFIRTTSKSGLFLWMSPN